MRERGSNTARPTEKGVGGLPIRSRFGRDSVAIRSISVDFGRFWSAACVAIRSCRVVSKSRRDSVDSVVSKSRRDLACFLCRVASRFGVPVVPVASIWSAACVALWRAGCADSVASCPVAIWRAGCAGRVGRVLSRFGVLLVSRFGVLVVSVASCRDLACRSRRVASKSRRKHKKSPIP